jgi:hypothetical protein
MQILSGDYFKLEFQSSLFYYCKIYIKMQNHVLIKWNSQISEEFFIIEQGVRQGSALSADLYKVQ